MLFCRNLSTWRSLVNDYSQESQCFRKWLEKWCIGKPVPFQPKPVVVERLDPNWTCPWIHLYKLSWEWDSQILLSNTRQLYSSMAVTLGGKCVIWVINGEQGWRSSESKFHSRQDGPDSIPGPSAISGLSLLWFSTLLQGFFSGFSSFSPQQKSSIQLILAGCKLCSKVIHEQYSGSQRPHSILLVQLCWAAPLHTCDGD